MQLSSESLLFVEFLVPCLLALAFGLGHILKARLLRWLIFSLTLTQVVATALRPAEYNSDTWNYSGYVEALSSAAGFDILQLTKFEPFHLLLAVVASDFRLWLLLEAMTAIFLLRILIWRTRRLETLAVVIGCSLPLMSSSLRFAIGLLAVACALLVWPHDRWRLWVLTAVGAVTHASLAVAGILQRRQWVMAAGLLLLFFAATLVDVSILERAGVTEDTEIRPTGIRTFACLLALMAYLRWRLPSYRKGSFSSDLISALGVLVLSLMFFPVVNRWLILMLIIVAVDSDAALAATRTPRRFGSRAAVLLYATLLVPFLYSVASQVASGDWFVAAHRSGMTV